MKPARILATAGLAGSLIYGAAGVILLYRWLGSRQKPCLDSDEKTVPTPSLRIFKPTTNWDESLIERSQRWLQTVSAHDQVEILTDNLPPSLKEKALPVLGQSLVELGEPQDLARNPKMLRLAMHTRRTVDPLDWWVCVDQEVEPEPPLLDELHARASEGEAIWSFPYRFHGDGWPCELDRAAFHLSQWPGIALLQRFGKINFCLGAVMLMPSAVIRKLGGFDAFTRCLAEDYQIGRQAARLEVPVRIADQVVSLQEDPMNWRQWWRHQRRMQSTFRHNNPKGYAGSLLVMTGFWGWIGLLAGLPGGWILMALLCRAGFVRLSSEIMKEKQPWKLTAAAIPAQLLEPLFWVLAWLCGNRVWWRNRWLHINKGGTLPE